MKKICFSTLGCIDNTLEQTVALAKKYGIDTLEIRGIAGEMDNTKIECFLPENTFHLVREYGAQTYPSSFQSSKSPL